MFSTAMLQTILNLHPPTRLELLATEITAAGITFRGPEYNFCVSHAVIPAHYWTRNGQLKSLTPLDQRGLITREIFKRKNYHFARNLDNRLLIARMQELYFLLEHPYKPMPLFEENIHWIALLAATARLFSLLDEQGPYRAVLPAQFKAGVRNIIYHCQGPFDLLDGPELIAFLAHCYTHCREALRPLVGETCLPLSRTILATEKDQPYFALAIEYSLRKQGKHRSEIKGLALDRLSRNKAYLAELIAYFQQHPTCFLNPADPQSPLKKHHLIGSVLGAQVAWIGCDASSLLKGQASRSTTDSRPAILMPQEARQIRETYGEYITQGIHYRHQNEPLSTFVKLAHHEEGTPLETITLAFEQITLSIPAVSEREGELKNVTVLSASISSAPQPALKPPPYKN